MGSRRGKDYSAEPIQLWIDEQTAFEALEKTATVLRGLISEVFAKDEDDVK